MSELPPVGRKHCCVISGVEMMEAENPKRQIVDRLIEAGAPIVVHKSRFDFSDYQDDEIRFTGIMVERIVSPGSDAMMFEWD